LIPMREHPHIVKLHRKPDEEAAHFGGAWHSDWSFQSAPLLQLCFTQKLFRQ